MLDSLSQKINLKVNGFQIILNQELNESELESHKFKKVGFFGRRMIKAERNEVVFWSKNSKLTYLKEDLGVDVISPILDAKAGAAIMFGTSSYLYYKQNNLSKSIFQIIQNKMAAQHLIEKFEQKLVESIGKSYSTDGAFTTWEMGNQRLLLEYPKNEHGYIHLTMINDPKEKDRVKKEAKADEEVLHHLESESSKTSGTTISNEDAARVAHGSVELLVATVDGYESGQTSQVVPKIVDAVGGDRETTKNVVGGELLCLLMGESLKGIEMFIAMNRRGMSDFAACADAFRSQIASTVGRVYDTDPAEMDRYFRERVIYYMEAAKSAPKENRSQVLAESWALALEGQLDVQLEAQFRAATIDEVATLVSDYPKRQQLTLIRWAGKL